MMQNDEMTSEEWYNYLKEFQTEIAESWLKRGKDSQDPFARFFFFFSAFNALYFYWRVRDRKSGMEVDDVVNLLKKHTEAEAKRVLQSAPEQVKYFCTRDPIRRMGRRSADAAEGDPKEGCGHKKLLRSESPAVERLKALGQILYFVRCNLVQREQDG